MSSLREKIEQLRARRVVQPQEPQQPEAPQPSQRAATATEAPARPGRPAAAPAADRPQAQSAATRPAQTVKKTGARRAAMPEGGPTYLVKGTAISVPQEECDKLKVRILDRLYEILDATALTQLAKEEVVKHVDHHARGMLAEEGINLNRREQDQLIGEIVDEMTGYGPLEPLLQDSSISDILVNGPDQVYVERFGRLELTNCRFRDAEHVMHVIDKMVSFIGRTIDEGSPMCDARLADGSRVNAIIPPLAIDYPTACIRKFRTDVLGAVELVNRFGTITDEIAITLQACVKARLNMLISGGAGSGKTTLLNIMSSFIPADERIVTIEEAAELQLRQPHVVRLETRPPNLEGSGEVTPYDLVRNSLRMRPDRIILGEVRGQEALDMLQAMNTGHEGSMSTVHANSPRDAIGRLETMIAMGGLDLPQKAIRQQIASAIDIIMQVERLSDGTRKVTSLAEVLSMEGDTVTMQDIFVFEKQGLDKDNNVLGRHVATGVQPRFLLRLKASGIELPAAIFLPEDTVQHTPADLDEVKAKLGSPKVMEPEPTYHVQRASISIPAARYNKIKNAVQRRLYDALDSAALSDMGDQSMVDHMRQATIKLLDNPRLSLNQREKQQLVEDIADEMLGYGPLEPLLKDKAVSDILVNGAKQIYIERGGKLELTDVQFSNNDQLLQIIDRIVSSIGRHIDDATPMCDARLPDGSRVNAIIPPLAVDYPSMSIRKFKTDALSIDDLVTRFDSLSPEMALLLSACVKGRLNILISGGTGSGKTTLLNILSASIPITERIITIEDSAELQLQQPHVLRLETRPANIEGKGAVNQYDLLRNSLRMRADRIILGEVRGREALDMLQAMNTGHEGSMSTVHANTPRDALSRLETMVAMGGLDLPARAMRQQIASAIDVIVQGNRFADGTRKLTFISEVMGMEGDMVVMQDLFVYEREGIGEDGNVIGTFLPTGVQPRFLQRFAAAGISLPPDLFIRK